MWLSSSNQGIAIGAEVFCFFECLHTAWNTRANHTAKTEECNTSDPSINAGFTFHFRCHFLWADRTDHSNRVSAKLRLGNRGTVIDFDFIEFKFRHLWFLDFPKQLNVYFKFLVQIACWEYFDFWFHDIFSNLLCWF